MVKKHLPHYPLKVSKQLRIIAGQWRGRKLSFTEAEGLRPTPDRIRETLFNWLNAVIQGSHCLDLFAGSGALALEALSRGAHYVDLVEIAPDTAKQLRAQILLLKAENSKVWQDKAQLWLDQFDPRSQKPYDIVFMDPPFGKNLAGDCIKALVANQVLATQAHIYLEMGTDEALPTLPTQWQVHREKIAGQVCYRLITTA